MTLNHGETSRWCGLYFEVGNTLDTPGDYRIRVVGLTTTVGGFNFRIKCAEQRVRHSPA